MILFAFFGSLMIGGLVGFFFERWGITHNGYVASIMIALGAVVAAFTLKALFHISFGPPGVDAIISSIAALVLLPTEWAQKRRKRRR
ncbi:MAG: hypothetical protein AAGF88_02600 [Pseudomonadota bacterium]